MSRAAELGKENVGNAGPSPNVAAMPSGTSGAIVPTKPCGVGPRSGGRKSSSRLEVFSRSGGPNLPSSDTRSLSGPPVDTVDPNPCQRPVLTPLATTTEPRRQPANRPRRVGEGAPRSGDFSSVTLLDVAVSTALQPSAAVAQKPVQKKRCKKVVLSAPVSLPRVTTHGNKRKGSTRVGIAKGQRKPRDRRVVQRQKTNGKVKESVGVRPAVVARVARAPPKLLLPSAQGRSGFDIELDDMADDDNAASSCLKEDVSTHAAALEARRGKDERRSPHIVPVTTSASQDSARRPKRTGGRGRRTKDSGRASTLAAGKKAQGRGGHEAHAKRRRVSSGGRIGGAQDGGDGPSTGERAASVPERGGALEPVVAASAASSVRSTTSKTTSINTTSGACAYSPRGSWHLGALFGESSEDDEDESRQTALTWRLSDDEDDTHLEEEEEATGSKDKNLQAGDDDACGSRRGSKGRLVGSGSRKKGARGKRVSGGSGASGRGSPRVAASSGSNDAADDRNAAVDEPGTGFASSPRVSARKRSAGLSGARSNEEQEELAALLALYNKVDSHRLSLSR